MSAISALWIVRDPTDVSELVDVVWSQDVRSLGDYCRGCPGLAWTDEHHTLYTSRDEAILEALRRLSVKQPGQEAVHVVAAEAFGYGLE